MISSDVTELLRGPVMRTREILQEAKQIRTKSVLSECDYRKLAELRVEMLEISPPGRFVWLNAKPAFDLWETLIEIEERGLSEMEAIITERTVELKERMVAAFDEVVKAAIGERDEIVRKIGVCRQRIEGCQEDIKTARQRLKDTCNMNVQAILDGKALKKTAGDEVEAEVELKRLERLLDGLEDALVDLQAAKEEADRKVRDAALSRLSSVRRDVKMEAEKVLKTVEVELSAWRDACFSLQGDIGTVLPDLPSIMLNHNRVRDFISPY